MATAATYRRALKGPRLRLAAVAGAATLIGVVVWAVSGGGSSSPTAATGSSANPIAPVALSAQGLRTLARAVKQPIYWDGPKAGYMYELTRTATGRIYVRYLPPGVKAGAHGARYLIVATYPYVNALGGLRSVAGGKQIALPGGGIAVVDAGYPKSVHLAYPGVAYQVEVYDPSPAAALGIASSGGVRPVR
jgi:hypothetical protein